MSIFLDIVKSRYSCRDYSSQAVTKEMIIEILEASRLAPSATNAQPIQFVVITQTALREQIASCYSGSWLQSAPVIIVGCGNYNQSWQRADGKNHCDIDLGIAVDHLTLSAAHNGLATCWVCKFDAMKCAEILHLPKGVAPMVLIPLGYAASENNYSERHLVRKPLNELVSWEGYNF